MSSIEVNDEPTNRFIERSPALDLSNDVGCYWNDASEPRRMGFDFDRAAALHFAWPVAIKFDSATSIAVVLRAHQSRAASQTPV